MRNLTKHIRVATRKLVTLMGLTGLTFAAGIDWAQAAENSAAATGTMPGELHVVFLFLLTLGGLVFAVVRPQDEARVRGRAVRRRTTRR